MELRKLERDHFVRAQSLFSFHDLFFMPLDFSVSVKVFAKLNSACCITLRNFILNVM